MCRPIRAITQGKGFNTSSHVLSCFGGAGGQHCCAIARALGIKTVFVHKFAGILSAYGMSLAEVVHEETIPCAFEFSQHYFSEMNARINELIAKCKRVLIGRGFCESNIIPHIYLNMRYAKTDHAIMTRPKRTVSTNFCENGEFVFAFEEQYKRFD